MRAVLAPSTRWRCLLALALCCGAGRTAAQFLTPAERLVERPRVELHLPTTPFAPDAGRAGRPRLIGMPSGFLVNPLGAESDDPAADDGAARPADDMFTAFQFNYGSHNPFFELRRPGDPGGVGYKKFQSQMQLFDLGPTSFSLGLHALTPAAVQDGGVPNGLSYVMPSLAWFHELGEGLALQGYVGQNIEASSRWSDRLNENFQYSMAVQCPLPGTAPEGDQGMFLFFQALGRYRSDALRNDGRPVLWEFVPGVQWRMRDNCWMSFGASRYNFLSCQWQY